MTIQNNSVVGVVIGDALFQNETLTAAGAVTWVAGTLLGRITASGKMTAYTSGATDGSQTPIAVLTTEVVFAGAGDAAGRPLISGKVRNDKLVAHGVGAITKAEADTLRSYTIIPQVTKQLADLDNQ